MCVHVIVVGWGCGGVLALCKEDSISCCPVGAASGVSSSGDGFDLLLGRFGDLASSLDLVLLVAEVGSGRVAVVGDVFGSD